MDFIDKNFEILLTVATIIVIVLNVFNHWYISKAKMKAVYILSMFVYFGYTCIETTLAFRHPEQMSILLFNIINIWAFSCAFKGFLRLKQEKKGNVKK